MSGRARFAAYWIAALVAFVLVLFVLRSILLPFVMGMAIAYALDPAADWLGRRGLGRLWAAVVLLLLMLIVFVVLALTLGPILVGQLLQLANDMPSYVSQLQDLFGLALDSDIAAFLGVEAADIQNSVRGFLGSGGQIVATFVQSIWSGGRAVANILSLLVITPFVAFYLLRDWDEMIRWLDDLLPRQHADEIRVIASQIDGKVAKFVRGQLLVGVILGVFYATGLVVIGVNFGLLIGLIAGLVSFVPYLGFAVGFVLSMMVAIVQFWPDPVMPIATAAVFMVGQFVESYVLYPRLLGRSVGLHPVWLFFSLFAFGLLFGFAGLLIAIPAAAAVGVLFSHLIERYRASPMYDGSERNRAGNGS